MTQSNKSQSSTHLFWDLTEVVDEADCCVFLERVVDAEDVDVALVEEVVKDVDGVHGALPALLVPEDQVDPLV